METEGLRRLLTVSVRVEEVMDKQVVVKTEREGMFWQPWLDTEEPKQSSPCGTPTPPGLLQKQTTKWKRDRRRLPEYSRKSDPKYPVDAGGDPPTPTPTSESNGGGLPGDTPLDMSVRHRGLPPSYAQTINSPGYRSNYRPSVIAAQNGGGRDELPQGISMCDPIIEEHFRRSLGSAYHTVFQSTLKETLPAPPKSPPKPPTPVTPPSVIELMDSEGLSVDDHFAKALGDTWKKLNRKDPSEIKGGNVVSI
nr:unnamed protein product [Callosobruchus chinensis]